MRRLEGVMNIGLRDAYSLKKYSLLFDKLHLVEVSGAAFFYDMMYETGFRNTGTAAAQIDYLQEQGFVAIIDDGAYSKIIHSIEEDAESLRFGINFVNASQIVSDAIMADFKTAERKRSWENLRKSPEIGDALSDSCVRLISSRLWKKNADNDIVSICRTELPVNIYQKMDHLEAILRVAFSQFPTPGEGSSWQDIFDFKHEMHDKQWNFRRFLHTLATERQTEAEIRDDIEWTLSEYTKAMNIHHLKAGESFVEVCVIPVIEFAEDLVKFNWSKIAKGVLGIKKRQIELMEAEMNAQGRECAYLFDAQKEFGTNT